MYLSNTDCYRPIRCGDEGGAMEDSGFLGSDSFSQEKFCSLQVKPLRTSSLDLRINTFFILFQAISLPSIQKKSDFMLIHNCD